MKTLQWSEDSNKQFCSRPIPSTNSDWERGKGEQERVIKGPDSGIWVWERAIRVIGRGNIPLFNLPLSLLSSRPPSFLSFPLCLSISSEPYAHVPPICNMCASLLISKGSPFLKSALGGACLYGLGTVFHILMGIFFILRGLELIPRWFGAHFHWWSTRFNYDFTLKGIGNVRPQKSQIGIELEYLILYFQYLISYTLYFSMIDPASSITSISPALDYFVTPPSSHRPRGRTHNRL